MPKKALNGAKGMQARVKRAEAAIEEILKRENVVITASKVLVIFSNAEGKRISSDVMSCVGLVQTLNRPTMRILPQVQLEAKLPESAPRHTKD